MDHSKPDSRQASHLVILGHPSEDSFNAAIARRYAETVRSNYQVVTVRDLYALKFEPCLGESERFSGQGAALAKDVQAELDLLDQCDVVTFVYPLWFGMPPAIIKGYLDRIFGAGFRLDQLGSARRSLFTGKQLAVISTSASSLPWLESQGMWVSLRQSFEVYLKTIFGFARGSHYHADSIVDDLPADEAERILYEIEQFTRTLCAEAATAARESAE